MDEREKRVAALANITSYNSEATKNYIDGAPHIKHTSLRALYANLVTRIFYYSKKYSENPKVLDLGAGEGSATFSFLELGAKVCAVDSSVSQLDALRNRCKRFDDRLELRCEDISETLKGKTEQYDIVVANSFLHHIPGYLGMISEIIPLLTPHGQFFSFQDPLRYDSVNKFTKMFSNAAYFSWRIHKNDVFEGLKRFLRRKHGNYDPDSMYDNTEFHVIRNGVDQEAIGLCFKRNGFECEIFRYFSTQSRFFQFIGTAINIKNTFAVIARKKS